MAPGGRLSRFAMHCHLGIPNSFKEDGEARNLGQFESRSNLNFNFSAPKKKSIRLMSVKTTRS
jgi:hypothetical protein